MKEKRVKGLTEATSIDPVGEAKCNTQLFWLISYARLSPDGISARPEMTSSVHTLAHTLQMTLRVTGHMTPTSHKSFTTR